VERKLTCGNDADGKTEECELDWSIVSKIKTFSSRNRNSRSKDPNRADISSYDWTKSPGPSGRGQVRCVPIPSTRLSFAASVNTRKSRSRVMRGMPWSIQLWAIRASPRRALRRVASTLARNAPARCQ